MAIDPQRIVVVELSGDFSQKAADGIITPGEPVSQFFDWVLDVNVFVCAVLASPQRNLNKRKKTGWPEVTVSSNDAKNSRKLLENVGKSGFELVVGTRSKLNDVMRVYSDMGYREVGRCGYDSGDQHDPLRAAWNKESLSRAVEVAAGLADGVLCLFAHDADPVYLLYKEE